MNVHFLNLSVKNNDQRRELVNAFERVLIHGKLINGPELIEFENKIAELCGRKYAIGVNSGTDALYIALKSLGIGPGDEVITTSLSWIATANAIAMTGAAPVFADINDNLNIDCKSVESLISNKTKAILPVHYCGRICDMDKLKAIGSRKKIAIVEDAAQAFGAKRNDRIAGSFGDIACFSMNPMKVFAACGEAGIVLTDNDDIKNMLKVFRYNGTINKETCIQPGLNARMDTVQAALLLVRLNCYMEVIEKRRKIAAAYNEKLKCIVDTPVENDNEFHVYYTYTIQTDKRDELKEYLASKGIETKIQHPVLMPEQPAYKDQCRGDYPNAKQRVKRILSIPANEKIVNNEIEYICHHIKLFFRNKL